jgi:hypothetical protein
MQTVSVGDAMRKIVVLVFLLLIMSTSIARAGNIFDGVTAVLPEGYQLSAAWQGPYVCNEVKLEENDSYLRINFSDGLSLRVSASSSASVTWFGWSNTWVGDRSHVSFQFNSGGGVVGFKVTPP